MLASAKEIEMFTTYGKQITKAVRERVDRLTKAFDSTDMLGDTRIVAINKGARTALETVKTSMDELDELLPELERETLSIINMNNKPIAMSAQSGRHR